MSDVRARASVGVAVCVIAARLRKYQCRQASKHPLLAPPCAVACDDDVRWRWFGVGVKAMWRRLSIL